VKILLVVAALVDLALAALLVAVSGFFFGGGGPEGMHGDIWPAIGWWAMFIASLGAPVAGVLLMRHNRPGTGALIGWMPAIVAALGTLVPYHPY
jgi:hypothetical protein